MTYEKRKLKTRVISDESTFSETIYSTRLIEWSREIPPAKISTEWEKCIIDLIPHRLKILHPRCMEKTLNEAREIYENDTMNCRIASIVRTREKMIEIVKSERESYSKIYRDYHYDLSRNRKSLYDKYFLSHEINRRIMEIGSVKLPSVIVDLRRIIETGSRHFETTTLMDKMTSDVIRVAGTIKNEYYPEIVDIIATMIVDDRKIGKKHRDEIERRKTARLLRCAENLFVHQIIKIMMKTIDELTDKLSDYRRNCPSLNLRLVWNNEENHLSIEPPIHRIFSMWHEIVRSVENIATDLPGFQRESPIIDENHRPPMKIRLPDWYVIESHRAIDVSLKKATKPLETYFDKISIDFKAVTSGETRREFDELTSTIDQPEIWKKIISDRCNSWMKIIDEQKLRASWMTMSEDEFAVGRLDRSNAGKRLVEEIASTRKILVLGMLRRHELFNAGICRDFEDLRDKLLDLPCDPRQLFKLAETISYPSINSLMEKFETRIKRSMEMLIDLLTFTSEMSESHGILNVKTFVWLTEIKPIIARSNTMCESMKSELEDDLQRRVALLNVEIEAVQPCFSLLDSMNDADRLLEYEEHLRRLREKLDDLERQIGKINDEESLFKFPLTRFPSVVEIRDLSTLVWNLNDLGKKWRRDHDVWLHGPFERVNAAEVRRKTIRYRDSLDSLNSSLRVKIKNDMQQTAASSSSASVKRAKIFTGIVDDPDPLQQPAPLSLCSRIIGEIRKFESNLELIDCLCNPSLRNRHWREISLIHEENRKNRVNDDRSSFLGSIMPVGSSEFTISAPNAGTTLAKLLSLDLAKDMNKYRAISISADKELSLANRLDDMIDKWRKIEFKIVDDSSSIPAVKTLARLDEINETIEEHQVVIDEMKVSYFVAPIADNLVRFANDLTSVKTIVGAWLRVREKWREFETVFLPERIDERLARAREIFFNVNVDIVRLERNILEEATFSGIAGRSSELLRMLSRAEKNLEKVRETMKNYVDEARNLFPRFYFVTDRRIIDIIFEPVFTKKLGLLVRNCFDDMRGVECCSSVNADNNGSIRVKSIVDSSGREFKLVRQSENEENIGKPPMDESYEFVRSFVVTENAIRRTVRDAVSECFRHLCEKKMTVAAPEHDDEVLSKLIDHSLQIAGVCGLSLYWTSLMERALDQRNGNTMINLDSRMTEQSRMIEGMLGELRSSETSRIRRRIIALFVVKVSEQLDVTRLLARRIKKASGKMIHRDFAWISQIRHYWREDRVKIGIFDAEESYDYEYSNYVERQPIVRTPLTERCHHSLLEARRNRTYGLVHGPASSGKTTTIKALAQTLGVFFRVLDKAHFAQGHSDHYRFVDNVFRGLAACSSRARSCWLLFENIDLIDKRGLSIIAQRFIATSRILENPCFVIATITNRSESPFFSCSSLPEAIKHSFRPVAHAFPDAKRIAEISLFANGFTSANVLAEKLRIFEKYSRSLNSSTIGRYDTELGIVVSVVKVACTLKNRHPDLTEDELFARALVDVNLPRFIDKSDITIFQSLMDDLFENVALPSPNYQQMASAIRRVFGNIAANHPDPLSSVILKIIQLFEILLAKHAVLVVGSSSAGKTTIIDTLARSLEILRRDDAASVAVPTIKSVRINHRSFTSEELFGSYDEASGASGIISWKDGILTRAVRSFLVNNNRDGRMKNRHWQWLVLDGPPNVPFIDELTSLLDGDCKTLCLSSGEKILIDDSTSIIMEAASAVGATPATISRCGIVFVEETSTISWKTRIGRWVLEQQGKSHCLVPCSLSYDEKIDENLHSREIKINGDDEFAIFLKTLIEWALGACLTFAKRNLDTRSDRLTINENHTVNSVMVLLEIYLSDALGLDHRPQPRLSEEGVYSGILKNERARTYRENFFSWSQGAMLLSIVWALGGSHDRNYRSSLDEYCRSIWRTNVEFPYDVISLPSDGLIEDNTYVFAGNGCWKNFSDVMKKDNISCDDIDYFTSSRANSTCYVPTIDSVRYMSLLEIHVKHHKPFLLTGETAAGKSLYMRHLLNTKIDRNRYPSNFHVSADVSSSPVTSAALQKFFISRMKKIGKRAYGPSDDAELCVNFIDDMSAAGTSNVEDILRQLIRQYYDNFHPDGCWQDVDTGDGISLKDVMFLGAIDSAFDPRDARSNDRNSSERQEAARFFRHFNLYAIDPPSDRSIFRISYKILLANLRKNMFSADVSVSVTSIVNATIDFYYSLRRRLKPTPRNLQYRFNPRDVSRLVDGCSLIHKDSAETKVTLVRLWVHETMRTFADRVIDEEDADWLYGRMKECATEHFKDTWETVFDNLPKYREADCATEQLTRRSFRHLVFTDFMHSSDTPMRNNGNDLDNDAMKSRYEEANYARDALKNRAIFHLERYNCRNNENNDKLDIIVFPRMLEHLVRICRILDIPGGSIAMMSFGGASSGRRSLAALAAHVKSQRFVEFSCDAVESMMTPSSPVPHWREDFKRATGNSIVVENIDDPPGVGSTRMRDCAFFVADRDIAGSPDHREILGDILGMMKNGRTANPSIFGTRERDEIVKKCRLIAQNGDRNEESSSLEIMNYFYNQCRDKIHFILHFDGNRRNRRRRFDDDDIFRKIIDRCTVDCYEDWPITALHEIAHKFIRDIDMDRRMKNEAIFACEHFWRSAIRDEINEERTTKRLPVSAFVHAIRLYGISMKKRQNEIRASRYKYLNGLEKLKSADEEVRKMRTTLTRLRPELESSAMETAETMRKIERENMSVEMASVQVKREEEAANEIAKVAGILKEECEADLAVAIPILEDAIAALNTLKPADITLVKAMKNPPDTVKLVLAAVCVMLGVSPERTADPITGKKIIDYWSPSKRILGDMNFLQSLKDYDKDNIPCSVMSVVVKCYMNDESFMPHIVAKASSAAEGLCKWVRAMVSYDEVAKVVAPKKEKLATAERECNAILDYLSEKRRSLAALNEKLAVLNASLSSTLTKKLQLENEVAICTRKLKRAENLIASLAGEKTRWHEAAEKLNRTFDNLAGDVLLSCGIVALLSSMNQRQRYRRVNDWRCELDRHGIPNSRENYEFLGSLGINEVYPLDYSLNRQDHRYSLDDTSLNRENACIVRHSLLWPLILDPQNQANAWIKRVESSNGLVVVRPSNRKWLAEIRRCIANGTPILVENLDRADYLARAPSILRYHRDDDDNSSSSTFRLYMTSGVSFNEAAANRLLVEPCDLYKRFVIVNFTVEKNALEDRLLEIIVSRERPELRDTFERLTIISASNKKLLDREEEMILEILSGSSVNIIEDERATEKLDRWKNLTLEMRIKEAENVRATEMEMNEIRATYRPLTKYCSALYDTLADLVKFNHTYRFSLDWFIRLYVRSIDVSMRSVILDKRLNYLGTSFTLTLDSGVRNALRDEHKLLYSFLLSMKILLDADKTNRDELRTLLLVNDFNRKSNDDYRTASVAKNAPMELQKKSLNVARQLEKMLPDVFQNLRSSFREDHRGWELFRSNDDAPLPLPWSSVLTDFQRLIITTGFKPEKILREVLRLVENTLGWNSSGSSFSTRMRNNAIESSYDESSCIVPLIFVLPSYLQPHRLVEKCSKKMGHSSKILRYSMPPTTTTEYSELEDSIDAARKQGRWILLENCHLADDEWLGKLEMINESLRNSEQIALSFRLWLTSYPSVRFPISVLRDGTKIYCERTGDRVKENLLDFYTNEPLDDENFYDIRNDEHEPRAFSKLVYALCFFHSRIIGRNGFDDHAWNSPSYEFTDSDLKVSLGYMRRLFLREDKICERSIIEQVRDIRDDADRKLENFIDTLNYLVGECYYGGRILDPIDRDSLSVILRNCCNERLVRSSVDYFFDAGINFISSAAASHGYSAPNRIEHRDFVRHIRDRLPNGEASPRVFGLDDNAALLRERKNSGYFVRSLARSLSFVDDESSARNEDESSSRLTHVVRDLRKKLSPEDSDDDTPSGRFNVDKIESKYPSIHREPFDHFLIRQIEFYNRIVETILTSLASVENSNREDKLVESLVRNRVPEEWMIIAGPLVTANIDCSSLSIFIDRLTNRREFLINWTNIGHYRGSLWLGGSFDCRNFILTARLMLARKSGITLDRLIVDYEVTNITTDDEKPWHLVNVDPDGFDIHVHGLYLSGARWDPQRSTLVETLPKLFWNSLPVVRLKKRLVDGCSVEDGNNNYYRCPVNSRPRFNETSSSFLGTLSRNYVTRIPLESKDADIRHWIERRTLIFCNK